MWTTLAQDYDKVAAAAGAAGVVMMLIGLAIAVVTIAGMWKMFVKAGQPGPLVLLSFVPIANLYVLYVLLTIVGRPGWWVILMLVPFVNIVVGILVAIDLAKSFGKGTGFAIGLIFLAPIFYCILGFGDAQYVGPAAQSPATA